MVYFVFICSHYCPKWPDTIPLNYCFDQVKTSNYIGWSNINGQINVYRIAVLGPNQEARWILY